MDIMDGLHVQGRLTEALRKDNGYLTEDDRKVNGYLKVRFKATQRQLNGNSKAI